MKPSQKSNAKEEAFAIQPNFYCKKTSNSTPKNKINKLIQISKIRLIFPTMTIP